MPGQLGGAQLSNRRRTFGQLASFDFSVLLSRIALLGNWNKGPCVINMEFKLFITEIEKLLKNEHLEEDQRIYPCASCIALALLLANFIKKLAE